MFVLAVFLLLLRKSSSCAAPVFPRAVYEEAVYDAIRRDTGVTQNACTGRSTLNILWSCLATTFACTWVSVHPNIPFFGHNKWAVRRWRIFLMFLALLAPEIMIMWAMKQLQGAIMIRQTINKYLREFLPSTLELALIWIIYTANLPLEDTEFQRRKWTMSHAYYLQMGGFRLRFGKTELEDKEKWNAQVAGWQNVVSRICSVYAQPNAFLLC